MTFICMIGHILLQLFYSFYINVLNEYSRSIFFFSFFELYEIFEVYPEQLLGKIAKKAFQTLGCSADEFFEVYWKL